MIKEFTCDSCCNKIVRYRTSGDRNFKYLYVNSEKHSIICLACWEKISPLVNKLDALTAKYKTDLSNLLEEIDCYVWRQNNGKL